MDHETSNILDRVSRSAPYVSIRMGIANMIQHGPRAILVERTMDACDVSQARCRKSPNIGISVADETNAPTLNPAPIRIVERHSYESTGDRLRIGRRERLLGIPSTNRRHILIHAISHSAMIAARLVAWPLNESISLLSKYRHHSEIASSGYRFSSGSMSACAACNGHRCRHTCRYPACEWHFYWRPKGLDPRRGRATPESPLAASLKGRRSEFPALSSWYRGLC